MDNKDIENFDQSIQRRQELFKSKKFTQFIEVGLLYLFIYFVFVDDFVRRN